MRKLKILSSIILIFFTLNIPQSYSASPRIGLRELTSKNVAPMEVFLLETELNNLLGNESSWEFITTETVQKKILSLDLVKCHDDNCLKPLIDTLNLDYLLQGSASKDVKNNYSLSLRLYQRINGVSIGLELGAEKLSELKKTLPIVTLFIRNAVNPTGEKQETSAATNIKSKADTKQADNAKEISNLSQQLKKVTLEINQLEAQIRETQQKINIIQEDNAAADKAQDENNEKK